MKIFPRKKVMLYAGMFSGFIRLSLRKELKDGEYIREFEDAFKAHIGTDYALAISSGRLALQIIIKALGYKEEDEIIMPAYTFHAVPKAVLALKLKPVFVEIDQTSHNMISSLIEKKITPKTRAIIATHLFGGPCDIEEILRLGEKHKLDIIEDCAHAAGARYKGVPVGSFGKCAYFSFETVKPLNTMGGSMITTNDRDVYLKASRICANLSYPGYAKLLKKLFIAYAEGILTSPLVFNVLVYPCLILADLAGLNLANAYKKAKKGFKSQHVKFTNYQAFIGLRQLSLLNRSNEKRALNARRLSKLLDNRIPVRKENPSGSSIFYCFVVMSKNPGELSRKLLYSGIDTGRFIMDNCPKICNDIESYQITEKVVDQSLQIPVFQDMTTDDIEYIAEQVNRSFDQKNAPNK